MPAASWWKMSVSRIWCSRRPSRTSWRSTIPSWSPCGPRTTAMGYFEAEIARAVVLALFVPLIISSGGNSGSQATSLIIRALALRELRLRDWWKVCGREIAAGLVLGAFLGAIGFFRIVLWQQLRFVDYGPHYLLVALTVCGALIGVVGFGTLTGSMRSEERRVGKECRSRWSPYH